MGNARSPGRSAQGSASKEVAGPRSCPGAAEVRHSHRPDPATATMPERPERSKVPMPATKTALGNPSASVTTGKSAVVPSALQSRPVLSSKAVASSAIVARRNASIRGSSSRRRMTSSATAVPPVASAEIDERLRRRRDHSPAVRPRSLRSISRVVRASLPTGRLGLLHQLFYRPLVAHLWLMWS